MCASEKKSEEGCNEDIKILRGLKLKRRKGY